MIIKRATQVEILIIAFILLLTGAGHTRTWYVKPDQTGDAPTIDAAYDSTTTGDTILVAPVSSVNHFFPSTTVIIPVSFR